MSDDGGGGWQVHEAWDQLRQEHPLIFYLLHLIVLLFVIWILWAITR